MPVIKVEISVPEDNCIKCIHHSNNFVNFGFCKFFLCHLLRDGYKVKRCQECLDAEVKDVDNVTD